MPTSEGPLLPRRRLGVELKTLRERAKLRLDEVATQLMISNSKLSRLETGQGIPQPRDVRDLINLYQVNDTPLAEQLMRWTREGRRQGWWKDYLHVVGEHLDAYLALESGASVIRSFTTVLPGLLQTEHYARALLREILPRHTGPEIDQLVEIRLRRKEILLRAEEPARLLAVVDESALRRVVGSTDIMCHQLEMLIEWSKLPNVVVQVFPFEAGANEAIMGSIFAIFQFADDIDRDVVSIESHLGHRYLEQESQVLLHLRIFDSVSHRSLEPPASRDLIRQIIQSYPTPEKGEYTA